MHYLNNHHGFSVVVFCDTVFAIHNKVAGTSSSLQTQWLTFFETATEDH